MDYTNLTIKEAHEGLKKGDFKATELSESFLKNISRVDVNIRAYLEVFDDVLDQAAQADKQIEKGEISPLTGIPCAVKDNIAIEGKRLSAASKILEGYTAPYDSTVIQNLKKSGAIFLGRANMDEFAMGTSTESSAFQVTSNPHDTSRVPGGSSGGTAAAVAANMALGGLGSDTAGSIRQPASFCGVVGLKPTYGAVSRNGLIALGSSLDCIGPITKTVEDSEFIFNAIKGVDPLDSTTVSGDAYPKIKKEVKTIGVPWKFIEHESIDKRVVENFKEAVAKLESAGHIIQEVDLPHADYAVPAYYIYLPAEVSSNLSRFDGVKYGLHVDGGSILEDYIETRGQGFGPEPRRRILIGTYVLSAGYYDSYYNRAMAIRRLIREDLSSAFKDVDLIATPTTLAPAFKIGEKIGNPVQLYLEDLFTVLANHAGTPAISVPSGHVEEEGKKLPLGLQLVAPHMREDLLFEAGKKFENIK